MSAFCFRNWIVYLVFRRGVAKGSSIAAFVIVHTGSYDGLREKFCNIKVIQWGEMINKLSTFLPLFARIKKSITCSKGYWTAPEMIPNPEMIPKLTQKWHRPRNDSHFSSRWPRNDPQLIFGMEWCPRTMDRVKWTMSIKFSLIIFTYLHSLMTLIWNYTLNWIKRKYYLIHKV